jgi:hypothetical protein
MELPSEVAVGEHGSALSGEREDGEDYGLEFSESVRSRAASREVPIDETAKPKAPTEILGRRIPVARCRTL